MLESLPTISRQTLADFVRSLASTAPAPGAGAAGAVTLALAAGCAAKAFAISHRHNNDSGLERAAHRACAIATIALEGAQRDGDDFRAWLRSHADSAVKALEQDARILLSLSEDLEKLIASHRGQVVHSLESDILSALDLVAAFNTIETRNAAELQER